MVSLTENQQVIREELGRLLAQLPVPQTSSHPHQVEIAQFRADFDAAIEAVDQVPEVLSALESMLASDVESSFEARGSVELGVAWDRLLKFPLPTDADHGFLTEILSAVEGLRFLLAALSQSESACSLFDALRADHAATR